MSLFFVINKQDNKAVVLKGPNNELTMKNDVNGKTKYPNVDIKLFMVSPDSSSPFGNTVDLSYLMKNFKHMSDSKRVKHENKRDWMTWKVTELSCADPVENPNEPIKVGSAK